jgi:hypothetical protein
MLIGEDEFARYDIEHVADHVFEFTMHGLGLAAKVTRRAPRARVSSRVVKP